MTDRESLTVPADVKKPLKYIDGYLSCLEALDNGAYELWLEEMPEKYLDMVENALDDELAERPEDGSEEGS